MTTQESKVEQEALADFVKAMPPEFDKSFSPSATQRKRLNIDPDKAKNGLGQLVLTVVNLLHELMERQAIRRIDAGSLTVAEIDKLGITLMRQAQEIEKLRHEFNLEEEDLNLDLGPLGKIL